MRWQFLILAASLIVHSEVVDRIAVSVGKEVITESQIEEEIRVAAFLNHEQAKVNPDEKRKAAERLLEQTLLKRDMEFSHYPVSDLSEGLKQLQPIKDAYPTEAEFQIDLQRHGITEDQLRRHLWWQLTLLSYIDFRFRPSVQVPESEVKQYYEKKVTEWQLQGLVQIPALQDSRADIEKILGQQMVDQAVDRWLGDTRTQIEIIYRKEAFQ